MEAKQALLHSMGAFRGQMAADALHLLKSGVNRVLKVGAAST
jgi:hypothetical protein